MKKVQCVCIYIYKQIYTHSTDFSTTHFLICSHSGQLFEFCFCKVLFYLFSFSGIALTRFLPLPLQCTRVQNSPFIHVFLTMQVAFHVYFYLPIRPLLHHLWSPEWYQEYPLSRFSFLRPKIIQLLILCCRQIDKNKLF